MNKAQIDELGFGAAPIKCEGGSVGVSYGYTQEEIDAMPKPEYESTYVEVSMPVALEKMAKEVLYAMRRQWLLENGFENDYD